MDGQRFDALTKAWTTAWGNAANRRRVLGGLLAAGGLLSGRRAVAQEGEEACVQFCRGLPPGPGRGECIRDCATGEPGLFEACDGEPTRLCPGGIDGDCCEAGQFCCFLREPEPDCCDPDQFCCPGGCDGDPDDHTQCIPPPD
jgi:hypothetical protein